MESQHILCLGSDPQTASMTFHDCPFSNTMEHHLSAAKLQCAKVVLRTLNFLKVCTNLKFNGSSHPVLVSDIHLCILLPTFNACTQMFSVESYAGSCTLGDAVMCSCIFCSICLNRLSLKIVQIGLFQASGLALHLPLMVQSGVQQVSKNVSFLSIYPFLISSLLDFEPCLLVEKSVLSPSVPQSGATVSSWPPKMAQAQDGYGAIVFMMNAYTSYTQYCVV